jgi:PAS fold
VQALAGGKSQRVGWFRLYFDDERWEWSPEVERMHGYEPGTVQPTTALVLSHKHPEDYEQVAATSMKSAGHMSRSALATASSTFKAVPARS